MQHPRAKTRHFKTLYCASMLAANGTVTSRFLIPNQSESSCNHWLHRKILYCRWEGVELITVCFSLERRFRHADVAR
jgi:hypothetical protein